MEAVEIYGERQDTVDRYELNVGFAHRHTTVIFLHASFAVSFQCSNLLPVYISIYYSRDKLAWSLI